MAERPSENKITIRCGETIRLGEDTSLPVEVTAEPAEADDEPTVEEPDEGTDADDERVIVIPAAPVRRYRVDGPIAAPMVIRISTSPIVVEEPENVEGAVREAMSRLLEQGIRSTDSIMVEADTEALDEETLNAFTSGAERVAHALGDPARGGALDVEVHLFESGSGSSPGFGTGSEIRP